MSNRCKAFILLAILSFYIILSAMETVEYSQNPASNQRGNKLPGGPEEEITVGNKIMNISDYLADPRVKAFNEIHDIEFAGEWELTASQEPKIFGDSDFLKGKAILKFTNDYLSMSDWKNYGKSRSSNVKLLFIKGNYLDDDLYTIQFTQPVYKTFNISTLAYSASNIAADLNEMVQFEVQNAFVCDVSINLDMSSMMIKEEKKKSPKYKIVEDAPLDLQVTSSNCGFELRATLFKDATDLEKKTINYSILLTFAAIVNLYSVAKMIKQCIDTPTKASQISLITVSFILIWDTYICLAHLYMALNIEKLFHFFIMPTFWYFILFSIFETKLLIIVWRARYWNQFENQEDGRRAMANFYMRLYLGMVCILFLLYKFVLSNWFLLVMSLYLVPQIIHNAMRGGRVEFDSNYIFLMIGLRSLLPLYFKGCPDNIIRIRPSFTFCSELIFVMGLQILIVYYQSIYGSKFFIPARFLPQQYNYLVDLPEETYTADYDDCAICMTSLNEEVEAPKSSNHHARLVLNRLKPDKRQIMKTPCNHKFHVNCLVEWMSIKMECPTCRSALPVLD